MKIYTAMGLGAVLGVGYFIFQEKSIPKETICQFHSSPLTDVMTWIVGGMFAYKGYKYNDPLLAIFGTAAAMVHVAQTVHFRLYGFKGKALPKATPLVQE